MPNIPTTNPTSSDYTFWKHKPSRCTTTTSTGSTIVNIKASDGILSGLYVTPGPTGAVWKVWDSLTASGTVLLSNTSAVTGSIILPEINFLTGLTLTITNTSSVSVFYK